AAGLARIESRLATDPDSTAVLPAREALLRAVGDTESALVSARARTAALPPGPRRALERASVEAQAGDAAAAVDALRTLAEGAYPPPLGMRAAALGVLQRLPESADVAVLMRRMARDAILDDAAAPLEFYAYEALSAAGDPSFDAHTRQEFVVMIGAEAAEAPLHRSAESVESWRSACDFLAMQGHPAEAAEFVRARLEDVGDLQDADLALLARAAFSADALVGGGSRTVQALHLLGRLRGAGREPFNAPPDFPASPYTELAALFTLVGDSDGAERILEAACAVDPDDPVVLNNLAYSRAQRGVLDARTLDMARRAVAARPDDPSHLDTLAWVLYLTGHAADTGDQPGAVTLLRRAIARSGRNGGSAALHLHLGDALWRTGDVEGAKQAWKASVDRTQALNEQETLEVYRRALRRQTGLAAVDAARYYEEHDAAVARSSQDRLTAVAAGREPPVSPIIAPVAPAAGELK
ncbi:MAG: hypothetical protein JNK53_02155, partial [Phycisphaerae bacterium]|nr:hypothetical protein [Phycisphaerae bacterium]